MNLHLIIIASLVSMLIAINPYEILGIHRHASQSDIKKAYKDLVKIWHPDKNRTPEAEKKMMEINEAYGILSSPERKALYDQYGSTDQQGSGAQHYHYRREARKGPEGFFSFMFEDLPFGSAFHSHNWKKKNVLNRYNYQNIVLPDSHHKPFLLAVFDDMCFECIKIYPLWEKVASNLNDIGIGTYELTYSHNPRLANDIGVNWYPSFVGVVAGRTVRFRDYHITQRGLRDFLATILPHDNIDYITSEDESWYFQQSFEDNKPQCILFSKHMYPPLLFATVAYEYRSKVKFVYVDVKEIATKRLREKYNVNQFDPTVVILKEEPSTPVEVIRGDALKRGTLREVVARNLYLHVPRLSSPTIFNEICPKKYVSDRIFCLVLVVEKSSNFSAHLWRFRQMAKEQRKVKLTVRYLYLYEDIQQAFIKQLKPENMSKLYMCNDGHLPSKVLALWRHPRGKAHYSWLPGGWCGDNQAVTTVQSYVDDLVSGEEELEYEAGDLRLIDEHAHGTLWWIVKRVYAFVQHVNDSVDQPSWRNMSSIFFLVLVVAGVSIGFVFPLLSEYVQSADELPRHAPTEANTRVLGMDKLWHKTQKEFIDNAPRGQFCVALLIDSRTVEEVATSPIAQAYSDAIFSFTGDPTYKFTWLSLHEQLMWCMEIMEIKKFGEFLPGTVLAMNGFRKYVYVFRPDLAGCGNSSLPQISADFIGLESSDEEGEGTMERTEVKKAALKVREDLPRWLERLLEGTLRNKIKLEKWTAMESL